MKPFKTYNQQLNKLRAKGLVLPTGQEASKVKRILERENYYNIVNGYMRPFLQKSVNGDILIPKQFILGTKFQDMYALFIFDRQLRNALLEHLLSFETHFKTTVAYRYTEVNSSANSYLDFHSYTTSNNQTENVVKLISTLSNEIKKNVSGVHKRRHPNYIPNAIDHHLDVHDGVPLWVLVNFLTIGNMSYFYRALPMNIRTAISKDFSNHFWREYGVVTSDRTRIRITDNALEEIVKCVNFYRNICAHEERLFNYRVNSLRSGTFSRTFNAYQTSKSLPSISSNALSGDIFTLLLALKLVLPKKNMKKLIRSINMYIEEYRGKANIFTTNDLLDTMGFPTNWKDILEY